MAGHITHRRKGGNPFHGRGNKAGSPRTVASRTASRLTVRRAQSARRGVTFPGQPRRLA